MVVDPVSDQFAFTIYTTGFHARAAPWGPEYDENDDNRMHISIIMYIIYRPRFVVHHDVWCDNIRSIICDIIYKKHRLEWSVGVLLLIAYKFILNYIIRLRGKWKGSTGDERFIVIKINAKFFRRNALWYSYRYCTGTRIWHLYS